MLGKNYFEPIDDGEDYFYQIDSDQNVKYETLESIYNQLFSKDTLQEAKDLSLYVRNKNKYIDKSLTYGEVTFRTMAYIFEYCKSRFDINEEGYFYDLGSGVGCGIFSALLCFNFKKYIGIEFINALNNKANLNKKIFMDKFVEIHKKYDEYLPTYYFESELKNEILIDKPKTKKKQIKENKEKELDEKELLKLHEEKLKNYLLEGNNVNDRLNVLDIIYGKKEEGEDEGYMSFAKKCKIRNEKFFEEYEKNLKLAEKKKEEEKEKAERQMAKSPGYARRGTVHFLLHGPQSIFKQLEEKEEDDDEDKNSKDKRKRKNNILILKTMLPEKVDEKDKKKEKKKKDKKSSDEEEEEESSEKERIITPYIEFLCGNFMNFDLTKASFIFINSTCFSSELLLSISKKINKEVQNGCIVITLTKKLPFLNKNDWDIKKGFKRLMSWGLATIFVHRKTKFNQTSGNSTNKSRSKRTSSSVSSNSSSSNSQTTSKR